MAIHQATLGLAKRIASVDVLDSLGCFMSLWALETLAESPTHRSSSSRAVAAPPMSNVSTLATIKVWPCSM